MLNDYTYMIEVERHRDAIDFAARQRVSRQADRQRTPTLAWLRVTIAQLRASFSFKRQATRTGDAQQNIRYRNQIA